MLEAQEYKQRLIQREDNYRKRQKFIQSTNVKQSILVNLQQIYTCYT